MKILNLEIDFRNKKETMKSMRLIFLLILFFSLSTVLFDLIGLKLASQAIFLLTVIYLMVLLYSMDVYADKFLIKKKKYVREIKSYVIATICLLLLISFLIIISSSVEDVSKPLSALISLAYIFLPLLGWERLKKSFKGFLALAILPGNLTFSQVYQFFNSLSNLSLVNYINQAALYLSNLQTQNLPIFLLIGLVAFYLILKFLEEIIKILIFFLVIYIILKLFLIP